jgi:3'-5' exonuclease
MSDCVFDIETAPLPDSGIPSSFVEKLKEAEESEDWREKLGLYALSARVVVIGMLNPESRRGIVLYDNEHGEIDPARFDGPIEAQFTLVGGDEPSILEHFWSDVARYRRVITFNGRGFDVPFLMQRSLVREVPISADLMPPRYHLNRNHLDLQDVLSLFRATRPYGLAPWTQATGAESPKEGSVSGAAVGEAFSAGRTQEIAEYCARDVVATAQLAEKVLRLWAPVFRS